MRIRILLARMSAIFCSLPVAHRARLPGVMAVLVTSLGVISAPAQAAGLPLIISATVDYTHNTLTIDGQNFGAVSAVTLDSLTFPTQVGASSTQIIANFPSGKAPSSFTPGTYFLTVTFKNQLPTVFGVDIGANGPQGAAGLQGPAGAQGIQGLTGAPGQNGAVGPPGPMGATGAPGAQGPAGAQGNTGPTGPAGATGATGPQGAPGANGTNGTNGTGAPVCSASDTVVSFKGALVCKSTLPHYVDNNDGTITDNTTGLMWEKQTSTCNGEVTCYANTYTWSSTSSLADGTLFTSFVPGLNGGDYYSPYAGQIVSADAGICFANHCDWRIPTLPELISILAAQFPNCTSSPCIDTTFVNTQASAYWSSSSWILVPPPGIAWLVYFDDGLVEPINKVNAVYARAVRSGR